MGEDFSHNSDLSSNMEDYIETISLLSRENRVVRVKDIAKSLGIKMPSVTAALIKLRDKDLITYEKYGYVELTEHGRTEAERVYDKHRLLKRLLSEVLCVKETEAEAEACRLEHYMTQSTFDRFSVFLNFYDEEKKKGSKWIEKLKEHLL